MKLRNLILSALAAFSMHANATLYDMGDGTFSQHSAKKQFIFLDKFTFSLNGPTTLTATAQIKKGFGLLGVALFADATTDTFLGSFFVGGTPNATNTKVFSGLTTGDYYYKVIGGFFPKGKYALSSSVGVAPEPAAYALALAGLGTLLFLRRRSTMRK